MSRYLFLCAAAPTSDGADTASGPPVPRDAVGLARGLVAAGHSVTLLTAAPAQAAARIPGLARRLSKLEFEVNSSRSSAALFEGRFSAAEPQLVVLERPAAAPGTDPGWLGAAVGAMAGEALLRADASIAWGETAAPALAASTSAVKLFVLPEGCVEDAQLARIGAGAAQAILVPGPNAARALESHPALADRAADEPIVSFIIGSDAMPLDPTADPALPASYSATDPSGKLACRRTLARRLGLVLQSRTLLLGWLPDAPSGRSNLLLETLARRLGDSIALAVAEPAAREAAGGTIEHARRVAIEHPARMGILAHDPAADDHGAEPWALRLLLGACDAVWLDGPRAARRAGLALRYGALPILPAQAAAAAGLVDVDVPSCSGNAVLVHGDSPEACESALVRAAALRSGWPGDDDRRAWPALQAALFASAPTWRRAAEVFDRLRERAEAGRDERLAL